MTGELKKALDAMKNIKVEPLVKPVANMKPSAEELIKRRVTALYERLSARIAALEKRITELERK